MQIRDEREYHAARASLDRYVAELTETLDVRLAGHGLPPELMALAVAIDAFELDHAEVL